MGIKKDEGTNSILRTARAEDTSSLRVAPLIFFATFLTHICQGSAGREGAALQIGGLLSGSVMTETVFSIPGLGRLLVDSINYRDYKVVQALLLFFALEYIIINLITDIVYGFLNPKIRYN